MHTIDVPIQSIQDSAEPEAGQSGDCCRTTDDGSAYCAVPQAGQSASCGCNTAATSLVSLVDTKANSSVAKNSKGKTVRGWLMFGVACLTSPCCTPLLVPLVLALLAGTPLAAWLGHNLGWFYGSLTLLSAISFVVAVRWLNKPKPSRPITVRLSDIPVISTQNRS